MITNTAIGTHRGRSRGGAWRWSRDERPFAARPGHPPSHSVPTAIGVFRRIAAESAAIDVSQMPRPPPAVELVAARAARDADRAAAAATAFSLRGNVVGELWGWEEAAAAAAG